MGLVYGTVSRLYFHIPNTIHREASHQSNQNLLSFSGECLTTLTHACGTNYVQLLLTTGLLRLIFPEVLVVPSAQTSATAHHNRTVMLPETQVTVPRLWSSQGYVPRAVLQVRETQP
jgi:hypothetical protein